VKGTFCYSSFKKPILISSFPYFNFLLKFWLFQVFNSWTKRIINLRQLI